MNIKAYIRSLVPAAIVLFFALRQGNGFFVLMLLPFFFAVLLYGIVRIIRRPEERKSRLAGVAVWAVTLAIAVAIHVHWNAVSRTDADGVAAAVLAYKDRTGGYPVSLDGLELDREVTERWKIRYWVREGTPVLNYPASFMPLTLYEYDFDAREWRMNSY